NLGHADTTMVEKHHGHLARSYIVDAIRADAPRFASAETAQSAIRQIQNKGPGSPGPWLDRELTLKRAFDRLRNWWSEPPDECGFLHFGSGHYTQHGPRICQRPRLRRTESLARRHGVCGDEEREDRHQ